MCIYEYAYNIADNRKLFWDYIRKVHTECNTGLNEDCSRYGHLEVKGLDW